MANSVPGIQPENVRDDVTVMATGRSDYPDQINNVLAFPGVFRGALDVRATTVNEGMKLAAGGRIVFCDQTDDYRVRPEPGPILEALRSAAVNGTDLKRPSAAQPF